MQIEEESLGMAIATGMAMVVACVLWFAVMWVVVI